MSWEAHDRAYTEAKMKFWDRQHSHPFLKELTDRLQHLGFAWNAMECDDEVELAAWRLPLFQGYALELSLMGEGTPLPPGYFEFRSTLFVISDRQQNIWNELRLWECLNLIRAGHMEPMNRAAPILVIFLPWLSRAWHDRPGDEGPFVGWSKTRTADAVACADKLGAFMKLHLPRLLSLLGTPDALAETLLNLETFPGKFDANGPRSANRSVHTAILLHEMGRTQDALRELDLQERQDIAAEQRGREPVYLAVTRCQNARLKEWMNAGTAASAI